MADRRQSFRDEAHEYHDPRVLLGTWFEERARRQADYREYVDLYHKGELPVHKMEHYINTLNNEIKCTESVDGRLLNGCIVGIGWSCSESYLSALPKSITPDGLYEMPCLATGALRPSAKAVPARSAVRIYREDQRIPDNVPIMHEECLVFCHAGSSSQLFLNLDSPDPMPDRNVYWVGYSNSHSLWKTTGKHTYIEVNSPIVIHHVASGLRLTMEKDPIQSLLGTEYKVICTPGHHEPDTWRFVAPLPAYLSTDHRHLRCKNVWDLNHRY